MPLCGPCTRVFRGRPLTAGTYYDHHLSWASFVAAADEEKCDICWRRFDALDSKQQDCLREFAAIVGHESKIAASAAGLSMGTSGYVKIDFTYNLAVEAMNQRGLGRIDLEKQKELDAISNFLLTRCQKLHFLPVDIGKDLVKPVTTKSTYSAPTWELVQSWLEECNSDHQRCAERRGSSSWYPTRLLDVDDSELETFKIVNGREIPPGSNTGYISLSHRWGSAEMPRLTATNMSSYRTGAPIADLPQTFRDAIAITRRLKARYIWIDSLCIIQEGDGGKDWMQEAPQMADVYSKCLLNISADWSGGEHGLFFDRESYFSHKFEIEFCLTAPKQKKQRGRGQKQPRTASKAMYTYIPAYNLEQVDDSPLAARGWVFQERILSPVILHFGRREVLWECCQRLASESLPSGLEDIPLNDMRTLSQSATLKRLDPEGDPHLGRLLTQAFRGSTLSDETVRDTPYLLWWFLISKYCHCALTFASDRLVAVSGVARYFKGIIKDQYVVGMWRKHLAIEMAWKVKSTSSMRNLNASKYPGPSFSWTSVECDFEPMNPVYDPSLLPYVEVEPVEVLRRQAEGVEVIGETDPKLSPDIVREDFFGPLTEPCVRIRVKGALKSARLVHTQQGQWLVVPTDISSPPSTPTNGDDGDSEESEITTSQQGVRALLDFVPSEAEVEEFQQKTFFYMLWYSHDHGTGHCFMLLEQQEQQQQQGGVRATDVEFRRICAFRPTGFGAGKLTEALLREQTGKSYLPGYDEGSGCHVIYIV